MKKENPSTKQSQEGFYGKCSFTHTSAKCWIPKSHSFRYNLSKQQPEAQPREGQVILPRVHPPRQQLVIQLREGLEILLQMGLRHQEMTVRLLEAHLQKDRCNRRMMVVARVLQMDGSGALALELQVLC